MTRTKLLTVKQTKQLRVFVSIVYDSMDIDDLEDALRCAQIDSKTRWPTIEMGGERYLDSSGLSPDHVKILIALWVDEAAEQAAAEGKVFYHPWGSIWTRE